MDFKIITIAAFRKEAERLIKKYPSLKREIFEVSESLLQTPIQGTPLGHNCYKIRMAIASKKKGKSGGARLITCVYIHESTIYLLTIYDKSEKSNITDSELLRYLNQIE